MSLLAFPAFTKYAMYTYTENIDAILVEELKLCAAVVFLVAESAPK
jgi:hypothetical protein